MAFQCRPTHYKTSLVCRDEITSISCYESTTRLLVFSSSFLPLSRGPLHCDDDNTVDKHVDASDECSDISVTENVVKNCTGFKECNISASISDVHRNNCHLRKVFLKTVFVCVEMVVLKSDLVDRELLTTTTTENAFNSSDKEIERFFKYSKIHASNFTSTEYTEPLDILPVKQNISDAPEESVDVIVIVIGGFLITILSITLVILISLLRISLAKERRLQQQDLSKSHFDIYTIPEPDLFNRPH